MTKTINHESLPTYFGIFKKKLIIFDLLEALLKSLFLLTYFYFLLRSSTLIIQALDRTCYNIRAKSICDSLLYFIWEEIL